MALPLRTAAAATKAKNQHPTPNTEHRTSNAEDSFGLLFIGESSIEHPVSSIQYPVSSIDDVPEAMRNTNTRKELEILRPIRLRSGQALLRMTRRGQSATN